MTKCIFVTQFQLCFSYLQKRYQDKHIKEDDSDLESVQSEEFEEMISKMAGVNNDQDDDIDFMNEIGDSLKNDAKKSKILDY